MRESPRSRSVRNDSAATEPDCGSYAAPAATVVAIVRRAVCPEEAAATMSAFLLKLAADDPASI